MKSILHISVGAIMFFLQSSSAQTTLNTTLNSTQEDLGRCDGGLFPYFGTVGETNIGLFIAYMFALFYFFGGVAIAADVFMGSIETITSVTRTVKINAGQHQREVQVEVWNKTVSNLSLMALGSSAPEILLAIIEVIVNDFQPGDLGPGTIVGSAAFNMLIIIAICVMIKPVKVVEEINVLYITAAASVLAYVWLYIIVEVWSPKVCTIVEAAITCAFFPLLLILAYCADRGWFDTEVCHTKMKKVRKSLGGDLDTKSTEERAMEHLVAVNHIPLHSQGTSAWRTELRREIRKTARKNPNLSQEQVYVMVFQKLKTHPQSPVLPTYDEADSTDESKVVRTRSLATGYEDKPGVHFGFPDATYTCMQDAKQIFLKVQRSGDLDHSVTLRYKLVDATAKLGVHYSVDGAQNGTGELVFGPDQKQQGIVVKIVNSDDYEPNSHFSVELDFVVNGNTTEYHWINQTARVTIKDTAKFSGPCDRIIKTIGGTFSAIFSDEEAENAYIEQIRMSLRFEEDDDDDDDDDVEKAKAIDDGEEEHTLVEWLLYMFLIVPKVVLALFTPPVSWGNGWPAFFGSLFWIAIYTAICGDLAKGMGCTIGLADAVTAITFVAFGTSVPDTFASKIAAEQDPSADPAIGNVTGSNAVNVFLGIGLSWLVGAIYQRVVNNSTFDLPESSLGFAVMIFSIFAIVWFTVLTYRRYKVGGELGGEGKDAPLKYMTAGLFVVLWLLFVTLSSLVEYGHIDGF